MQVFTIRSLLIALAICSRCAFAQPISVEDDELAIRGSMAGGSRVAPLTLEFTLTNKTDQYLSVVTPLAFGDAGWGNEGNVIARSLPSRAQLAPAENSILQSILIAPKASRALRIQLEHLYPSLADPGEYAIKVSFAGRDDAELFEELSPTEQRAYLEGNVRAWRGLLEPQEMIVKRVDSRSLEAFAREAMLPYPMREDERDMKAFEARAEQAVTFGVPATWQRTWSDEEERYSSPEWDTRLTDANPEVRRIAALYAGTVQDRSLAAKIPKLLEDPSAEVRAAAAFALGRLRSEAVPALERALNNKSEEVRRAVVIALGRLGHAKVLPLLLKEIEHNPFEACEAIGNIGDPLSAGAIERALDATPLSFDDAAHATALIALGKLRNPSSIPRLLAAQNDPRRIIASAAENGLEAFGWREWEVTNEEGIPHLVPGYLTGVEGENVRIRTLAGLETTYSKQSLRDVDDIEFDSWKERTTSAGALDEWSEGIRRRRKERTERESAELTKRIASTPRPNPADLIARGIVYLNNEEEPKALEDFKRALEIEPGNSRATAGRCAAATLTSKSEQLAALRAELLDSSKHIASGDPLTKHIGSALLRAALASWVGCDHANKCRPADGEKLTLLEKAVAFDPYSFEAYESLGWTAYKLKEYDKALQAFLIAHRLRPSDPSPLADGARVKLDRGDLTGALKDISEAIRRRHISNHRDLSEFLNNGLFLVRAEIRYRLGDAVGALEDLNEEMNVAPNLEVSMKRARLLSTATDENARNGARALASVVAVRREMGSALKSLDGDRIQPYGIPPAWVFLETRAGALAELGEFENAIAAQLEAAEVAPEAKRGGIAARLALYRYRKPFRDTTGQWIWFENSPNSGGDK
ncbi:MAG: HEAT repeat domain-containing protein [Deltaproteobacteria bacterium]|nr:HEAT repeat domain-containing protein [Deltaproteobacteria bacterium]